VHLLFLFLLSQLFCWKKLFPAETDFVTEYEFDARAVYMKINGDWKHVGYDAKGFFECRSAWTRLYNVDKAEIGYVGGSMLGRCEDFVGKPEDQAVFDYWKSHVRERNNSKS
jgi:hypothetical protein